jgi:hypothetical protein
VDEQRIESLGVRVSLFGFARFAAASPAAKVAAVRGEKVRPAYDPRADFWKQFREFLRRNHRQSGTPEDLISFASTVHARRVASYIDRATTYADWWVGRDITWAGGSARVETFGMVEINVNPELLLSVDGSRLALKLHFSAKERLSDDRAALVVRLLARAYPRHDVGVFDLAGRRFHIPTPRSSDLDPVLIGEAAALAAMWDAIE